MLMLTIGQEHSMPIKINAGQFVWTLTFTVSGEYPVTGHGKEVRVWRVKDGTQVARMETGYCTHSLAASQNGKWVATGTEWEMLV